MTIKTISLASDHAAFELKAKIAEGLERAGYNVIDNGTNSADSVDYPDYAEKVCQDIISKKADRGILLCGSGVGMSIAANRHREIRAALCHNAEIARLSREHNDANILVLGARAIDPKTALECVDTFLQTDFAGGRHETRVGKLTKIGC